MNEEPVFKTSSSMVVKFYRPFSREELLWGHYVPNSIPMEIGQVKDPNQFSFQRKQAAPEGMLFTKMPLCQVLMKQINKTSLEEIATNMIPNIMMIHALGCEHNDIKTGNIMALTDEWRATDFGLAMCWRSSPFSFFRSSIGTPLYSYRDLNDLYLVPGVMRDCFGLAAVLYESVTHTMLIDLKIKQTSGVALRQLDSMRPKDSFAATREHIQKINQLYATKIDSSRAPSVLAQTMKELIAMDHAMVEFKPRTNIFRAAKAFFSTNYSQVLDSICDSYMRYAQHVLSNWEERVSLISFDSQLQALTTNK